MRTFFRVGYILTLAATVTKAISAQTVARPPVALPAPTDVAISGSGTTATVSWKPAAGAASYRVLRSTTASAPGPAVGTGITTTSFVDRGVTVGSAYYYQVYAVFSDGRQSASTSTRYTAAPSMPGVVAAGAELTNKRAGPSSLTAAQTGAGTVQLSWSAVPGAVAYFVTGAGSVSAGLRVTATSHLVTGVPSPGMQTWKVTATFNDPQLGNIGSSAAVQAMWMRAAAGGFVTPVFSNPSFQLTAFNDDEGARTDSQGRMAYTNLPLKENPRDCPYTPMFYYDGAQAPAPAAGFYLVSGQVQPDSDPAWQKYTIMSGGHLYFRAPVFPGLKYVAAPAYNAWVFVVNCRGEYSNAKPFRVYPTELQLLSVTPAAFIGGMQVNLFGTGFAGITPTDQKVFFHVVVQRGNSAGTSDVITRDIEAAPRFNWTSSVPQVLNERQINVVAPSLEGLGYGPDAGYMLQAASVYVVFGGKQTHSLPVRLCSKNASATEMADTLHTCWR